MYLYKYELCIISFVVRKWTRPGEFISWTNLCAKLFPCVGQASI